MPLKKIAPRTGAGKRRPFYYRDGSLGAVVNEYIAEYFNTHEKSLPKGELYDAVLSQVERPLIEHALKKTGGCQIKAAELLGIHRNTLRQKIEALAISDTLVASSRYRPRRERRWKKAS